MNLHCTHDTTAHVPIEKPQRFKGESAQQPFGASCRSHMQTGSDTPARCWYIATNKQPGASSTEFVRLRNEQMWIERKSTYSEDE